MGNSGIFTRPALGCMENQISQSKFNNGNGNIVESTVGRVLLSMVVPKEVPFESVNMHLKKKHNKEINTYWNNSAITPGTKFMERITLKVVEFCKSIKNVKIYFKKNLRLSLS